MIDELNTSDIQRDEMEVESPFTRSIIDELLSWDIQGDQMECESDVTGNIIDHCRTAFYGYPRISNGR